MDDDGEKAVSYLTKVRDVLGWVWSAKYERCFLKTALDGIGIVITIFSNIVINVIHLQLCQDLDDFASLAVDVFEDDHRGKPEQQLSYHGVYQCLQDFLVWYLYIFPIWWFDISFRFCHDCTIWFLFCHPLQNHPHHNIMWQIYLNIFGPNICSYQFFDTNIFGYSFVWFSWSEYIRTFVPIEIEL